MKGPSKWVVICCPVSGKKDAVQTLEKDFFPRAKELNIDVHTVLTERAGHATELAEEFAKKGFGLIVVGGDGTIHEAMDGLIKCGKLSSTRIALLSQGTMNNYFHCGELPEAKDLARIIHSGSFRSQSLMDVSDNSGKLNSKCFEAIYLGVGYRPAKGAQEWRHTPLGPFFGIMMNLVKACLSPATPSVKGTLTLWPRDGSAPIKVKDTFYWIVITQRDPYNATLTPDSMWVSYLTLEKFPGFKRMMSSFSPPFEFMSGMSTVMENNVNVSKVTWEQEESDIGVCLDGDPMDGGRTMTVTHQPKAWEIVAEGEFPKRLADRFYQERPLTACAKEWLAKNPPPKGTFFPFESLLTKAKTTGVSEKTALSPSPVILAGLLLGLGALVTWTSRLDGFTTT